MRVKRGKTHVARRKRLLKKTKGYKWGRKNKVKAAKEATLHAGAHAYKGRKLKKRVNRNLWTVKINAAVRKHDMTYSKFMKALKDAKIELDRKTLAHLAEHEPKAFEAVVQQVKK